MIPNDGQIRWRCRRGMLEIDVSLTRFCDEQLSSLTDEDRVVFFAMLAEQDPVWWDWLLGDSLPDDPAQQSLLLRIKGGS